MNKPIDYNHVYLYAKHHYKRTDTITDLKIILSKRSLIDIEFISGEDIIGCLTEITWKEINRCGNPTYEFNDFVMRILPQNRWKVNNRDKELEDLNVAIINSCLSVLSQSLVKDDNGNVLLELGEPDSSILPLVKE